MKHTMRLHTVLVHSFNTIFSILACQSITMAQPGPSTSRKRKYSESHLQAINESPTITAIHSQLPTGDSDTTQNVSSIDQYRKDCYLSHVYGSPLQESTSMCRTQFQWINKSCKKLKQNKEQYLADQCAHLGVLYEPPTSKWLERKRLNRLSKRISRSKNRVIVPHETHNSTRHSQQENTLDTQSESSQNDNHLQQANVTLQLMETPNYTNTSTNPISTANNIVILPHNNNNSTGHLQQENTLDTQAESTEDDNPVEQANVTLHPMDQTNDTNSSTNELNEVHPNPRVQSAVLAFEQGETKHSFKTCNVCKETRPAFHVTPMLPSDKEIHAPTHKIWKTFADTQNPGNLICQRCYYDRRNKPPGMPAMFSGIDSDEAHLASPDLDVYPRHNNMHLAPIPPFLQNLTLIEEALISPYSTVMHLHMLKHGMLASKGHIITIPQPMKIAKVLPLLPDELNFVLLRRRQKNNTTKLYAVHRHAVQNALMGLCFGIPHGGYPQMVQSCVQYDGPDHLQMKLNNQYFEYLPNKYYYNITLEMSRFDMLPLECQELPGMKIIEIPDIQEDQDLGPAPNQHILTDDGISYSTITSPHEPHDIAAELRAALQRMIGKEATDIALQSTVATANWEYTYGEPLKELKTEGFFTLSAPSMFINGHADYTVPGFRSVDFGKYVEHLYFSGDGRIAAHATLKFRLLNILQRYQVLNQGSFLVNKQLSEPNLTIEELKKRLLDKDNPDTSVPRCIINVGGNLPNTTPYWNRSRRELDFLSMYHKLITGDLPAYFTTGSMAEHHWLPLCDVLAQYLHITTGEPKDDIYDKMKNDHVYRRKQLLKCGHIVVNYFDARTCNFFRTVLKELFQADDWWFRYEFAMSRGFIHFHSLIYSKDHATNVTCALRNGTNRAKVLQQSNETSQNKEPTQSTEAPQNNQSNESAPSQGQHDHSYSSQSHNTNIPELDEALNLQCQAEELHKWLQTTSCDMEDVFSPQFTSLHPSGGKEQTLNNKQIWIPNRAGWPKPEGTETPPDQNPLQMMVCDVCTQKNGVNDMYRLLTNKVGLHSCNPYCLQKKQRRRMDDKGRLALTVCKICRFGYGEQDKTTKHVSGKDAHPFSPYVNSGTHPRYEGPRDHPRMVQNVRAQLLAWKANCDSQPLIDQDLFQLQNYVAAYASKGNVSTTELISIYRHLLESTPNTSTVRPVVFKLLMQTVSMVDLPAAAVDTICSGMALRHSTRKYTYIGMSGYRRLNESALDNSFTKKTILDTFLELPPHKRTNLYEYAQRCNCKFGQCGSVKHIPVFTGCLIYPDWPLAEDYCKAQLKIFSNMHWKKSEDLLKEHSTYVDAFLEFMQTPDCPAAVITLVEQAKERAEREESGKKKSKPQETNTNTQNTDDFSSDEEVDQDVRAQLIAAQMTTAGDIISPDTLIDEQPLPDGGDNFDWHNHATESFGGEWPDSVNNFLNNTKEHANSFLLQNANELTLPTINLLCANPLQRVLISITARRCIDIAKGLISKSEPGLRILVQGSAGVGKSYTIAANTFVAKRVMNRNSAVLNIAPTATASLHVPGGMTFHSIYGIPNVSRKMRSSLKMDEHPLKEPAKIKLQTLTGNELILLQMDERSMVAPPVLAWAHQRHVELTNKKDYPFGAVPIVYFLGDLCQLGPVMATDMHVPPSDPSDVLTRTGHAVYRSFTDALVLTEVMRQKKDEKEFIEFLVRIRSGTLNAADITRFNARYECSLSEEEKQKFHILKTVTLMETWVEVYAHCRKCLCILGSPVAVVPAVSKGRHSRTIGQMGQLPACAYLAVGMSVMLTKNQVNIYGLNNGAVGKVISILYQPGVKPPAMPQAVVVYFNQYTGPAWMPGNPKWVPISPVESRCDSKCCSRTGFPLIPAYAIPIAKSQGMTIGPGQPITHARVKIQQTSQFENLCPALTYTALSRVSKEENWCLVEKVPADRLLAINRNSAFKHRLPEEQRIHALSELTMQTYGHFQHPNHYLDILRELDEYCNDGISCSTCENVSRCSCVCCQLLASQEIYSPES